MYVYSSLKKLKILRKNFNLTLKLKKKYTLNLNLSERNVRLGLFYWSYKKPCSSFLLFFDRFLVKRSTIFIITRNKTT